MMFFHRVTRFLSFVVVVLGISFFGVQSSASSADYSCTISVYDSGVTVLGTDAADVICVFGDNNTVDGLAGNDVVIDEGLNNTINLGPGDDVYDGSNGECAADGSGVTVTGGDGDDTLIGTPCDDELTGGDGGDSIIAGEGVDVLDGGSGDDELSGGFGDDELLGQPGSDVLDGGVGDDILIGGQDVDDLDGGIGLNVCDYTTTEVRTITCTYDDQAPVLSDFVLSPDVVDVGVSEQFVRVAGTVTDETAISWLHVTCGPSYFYVTTWTNTELGERYFGWEGYDGIENWGRGSNTITSNGAEANGVYISADRKTVTFDLQMRIRFAATPGSFHCTFHTKDSMLNWGYTSNLATLTINRTGDNFDDQAPVLSDFVLSPDVVDVGVSEQFVRVAGTVTDETAISWLHVTCGPSYFYVTTWTNTELGERYFGWEGYDGIENWGRGSNTITSNGAEANGVYISADRKTVTFDLQMRIRFAATPGSFHCTFHTKDSMLNWGYTSNLATLTINRTGDNFDDQAPVLSDFVLSPDVVDVGVSEQFVRVAGTVTDETAISWLHVTCGPSYFYVTTWTNTELGERYFGWEGYDGIENWGRGSNTITSNGAEANGVYISADRKTVTFDLQMRIRFAATPGSFHCTFHTKDSMLNWGYTSNLATLTINRTPPGLPQAPSGLGFVSGVGRPFEGVLSWVAPGWLGLPVLFDYEVQVSRDGGPWVVLSDAVTDGTSLSLSNLRPGSVYEFRVRGENGGNQVAGSLGAPWSEVLRVVLPSASVPDVPDGVVVDSVWSSGVVVDWVAPYDGGAVITDYVVEVSADAGVSWSVVPHVVSSASSMTVTGLRAGGSYLVRVAAVNGVGVSEFVVVGFVTPASVPDVPGGVRVSDVSASGVLLVWDAGFDGGAVLTDYVVEVSVDAGVSWSVVPHDPFVSQAFRVSGLTRATGYVFRVAAVNGVGVSGFSAGVDVVTLPSVPSVPRGLVVSDVSTDAAVFGWVAPSDDGGAVITDYVVEVSADAGVSWSVVADAVSPVPGVMLTGLDALHVYQVRVAAVNSVGVSPVLVGSFTTAAEVPLTIYNLAVVQSTKTTVKVTWDHPDADAGRPVTDYVVELSQDGVNFVDVRHTPFVTNQFTYTQLNPGTRYWFRLAAMSEGGVGEYSEIISHVTAGNPPAAPTGFTVKGSGTTVTLTWKAPNVKDGSPVRDYLVEYSVNGTTWLSVTKPVSTSTSLTIRNLKTKTTYHFRVKAINDVGISPASKTIKIKTK